MRNISKELLIALCLALSLCPARGLAAEGAAAAQQGPFIDLTEAMAGRRTVLLEGRARSQHGPVKLDYAVTANEYEAPRYEPLAGEKFSLKFTTGSAQPGSGFVMWLRARDKRGAESLLQSRAKLGYDRQLGYYLYFSTGALQAENSVVGSFTVLRTPGVSEKAAAAAQAKLAALRRLAEDILGLDSYPAMAVLLYSEDSPDKMTYSMFRGFILSEDVFAFPAPLPAGGDPKRTDNVLDNWIPHEFGDHGVRQYSPENKFAVRWLSEGAGDYLEALYRAGGAKENVQDLGRGSPARAVDLLDGGWSPDHYACSARFVGGLASRHPGALKELFRRLAAVRPEKRSEPLVRSTLSAILGRDITPLLKTCRAPD